MNLVLWVAAQARRMHLRIRRFIEHNMFVFISRCTRTKGMKIVLVEARHHCQPNADKDRLSEHALLDV